jgi:hypothetical protein
MRYVFSYQIGWRDVRLLKALVWFCSYHARSWRHEPLIGQNVAIMIAKRNRQVGPMLIWTLAPQPLYCSALLLYHHKLFLQLMVIMHGFRSWPRATTNHIVRWAQIETDPGIALVMLRAHWHQFISYELHSWWMFWTIYRNWNSTRHM